MTSHDTLHRNEDSLLSHEGHGWQRNNPPNTVLPCSYQLLYVFILTMITTATYLFAGHNKHQSAVTCLQFNRKFVITSSDDGTVKLWSLTTGEFLRNLVTLDSGGSGGVVWRVRADESRLVCASGSRNGTEDTKLIVLDFGIKEEETTPTTEHREIIS